MQFVLGFVALGIQFVQVAGAARFDLIRDLLVTSLFIGMNDIENAGTLSGTKIVNFHTAIFLDFF